ncbi:MAG: ATP-binding protein [Verrucomicrobiales bacterium]|nr:ATP-binding protein [Verrucomicrobiales bacterium]
MSLSRFNSSLTLELLCNGQEHQYLERKGRDTKPTKIANELIGMLNAGGGTLVFGIADDGVVEDLGSTSLLPSQPVDLDRFRTAVHEFIEPPANIELEELYLESGELIFLFHVEPDHERLFQRKDNEEVYLRIASENKGPLSREEVKKLEYNKSIRTFEDEVRPDFDPADLDRAVCESYRETMKFEGTFEELMVKRSLAKRSEDGVIFKNSAILLFAENPDTYIANASVRYVRYRGNQRQSGTEFNVVKDQRFEANIPTLIRQLEAFIEASLRDFYFLDMSNGKFVQIPEVPKEAWLEGIVNALCHRSYNLQGNPVMIRHFDNRLEILNSGPLPAQVTVENIEHERYARNPRIARALYDLGYVRELNEGVPRIYRAMRDLMLVPEYRDSDNTVTLTLNNKVADHKETILAEVMRRIGSAWEGLNETQKRIVEILFEQNEAKIDLIREDLDISEQAIRKNLKILEMEKIVVRVSDKIRDRNAIYRFPQE